MCIRPVARVLFWFFAFMHLAIAANAQSIEFTSGEIVIGGDVAPISGWRSAPLPDKDFVSPEQKLSFRKAGGTTPDIWLRLRFDRSAIGAGPAALVIAQTQERMAISLNGQQLYSSLPAGTEHSFAWSRPELITLPPSMLLTGQNELIFRLRSSSPLVNGAGLIRVGTRSAVEPFYLWHYLTEFVGPLVITGTLLLLTVSMLILWLVRRREHEFGLLALVGALWTFRNLHYFIATVPEVNAAYWELTVDSLFVLTVALYAFAAEFLKVPGRGRVIIWMSLVLGTALLSRYAYVALGINDIFSVAILIPAVWFVVPLLYRAWRKTPRIENLGMLIAMVVTNLMSMHDLVIIKQTWPGVGFYLQPYSGLLIYSAFTFALGRRILSALDAVEDLNLELQSRVATATAQLEASEAARRELEIEHALEQERERLMREIHDGIGSNLVTALGAAERQKASPETVGILRRSITDLKIAVDSLEPIEGDVAALLASFRHRIEPELNDAGITFLWQVEAVPALAWLDAVNALHIFRILQEATANIVKHSEATQISVACNRQLHGPRDGVLVLLRDNGRGFETGINIAGRGLSNMKSRAASLHGEFTCESSVAGGTTVSLWLPLTR